MARHRTSIDEWELYIPNVGDEQQMFADGNPEAITMELCFLSKREREHFQRVAAKAEKGPEQRKRAEKELRRMLEEHVRDIANVTIDGGTSVVTGSELYDSDEEDIKRDVAEALMSIGHLEEGLGKKLSTPSATSSSRQTSNTVGGAQDVTLQSSQGTQGTQNTKIQNSGLTMTANDASGIATENQERRSA